MNRRVPNRESFESCTPQAFRQVMVGLLSPIAMACSWQRFDDVTDHSPVQILETPGDISNAGSSVAAIQNRDGHALVLATGLDGFVIYDLGKTEPPSTDAKEQGRCAAAEGCFMADHAAAIRRNVDNEDQVCFAYGVDQKDNGEPSVTLRCEGGKGVALSLPSATQKLLGKLSQGSVLGLSYASSPRNAPVRLLVGFAEKKALAYFPSLDSSGFAIERPASVTTKSFGQSVALLDSPVDGTAAGTTLVVGEPDANRVHLIAVDDAGLPSAARCLEGPAGFGSLLAPGYFVDASQQGLAIGTARELFVLPSISELASILPLDGSCAAVSTAPSVKTLDCKGFGLQVTCSSALVRGSMAAADLNDDGVDELVVGVPSASTEGERAAGQLLSISVDASNLSVRERLSPSSAESGDRLGESIVAVPLSRPDVVLAGAPGGNKLAAFYCSALLPPGSGGKRCE